MHYAKVENSPRLQRVLDLLKSNYWLWLTTRDIIRKADVCAVNSCISELRANGIAIDCEAVPGERGQYRYRMKTPKELQPEMTSTMG